MMTSREQFEAWLIREYPWAIDALDKGFVIMMYRQGE